MALLRSEFRLRMERKKEAKAKVQVEVLAAPPSWSYIDGS